MIVIEVEDSKEERMCLVRLFPRKRAGMSSGVAGGIVLGRSRTDFSIRALGKDASLPDHSLFQERSNL